MNRPKTKKKFLDILKNGNVDCLEVYDEVYEKFPIVDKSMRKCVFKIFWNHLINVNETGINLCCYYISDIIMDMDPYELEKLCLKFLNENNESGVKLLDKLYPELLASFDIKKLHKLFIKYLYNMFDFNVSLIQMYFPNIHNSINRELIKKIINYHIKQKHIWHIKSIIKYFPDLKQETYRNMKKMLIYYMENDIYKFRSFFNYFHGKEITDKIMKKMVIYYIEHNHFSKLRIIIGVIGNLKYDINLESIKNIILNRLMLLLQYSSIERHTFINNFIKLKTNASYNFNINTLRIQLPNVHRAVYECIIYFPRVMDMIEPDKDFQFLQ